MALFTVTEFNGQIPRRSKRLLGVNQAEEAVNVDVLSGSLKPFEATSQIEALDADDYISLYLFDATGEFLKFKTDVDVVRGPITDDPFERIYYTGDGVPKIRGLDSGTEFVYDLGIPKPTLKPEVVAQAQSSTTWTREFHYFYEEPDGSQSDVDAATLTVTEVQPGVVYEVASIPAKISASAQSTFVLWFDAFDASGRSLGRLYPSTSAYAGNNDFFLGGAQASSLLEISGSSATLTISFDTSRSSEFTADRSYVYTLVSGQGEEGPPSDPSDIVVIEPAEDALISNLDTAALANRNITAKRIYRTVTGNAGTTFQFVKEIPLADATTLDNLLDADTGEVLPTQDFDPPPEELAGLVLHPGGFLAGFVGQTVYFSAAFLPHAWPTGFAISVEYPVVGLGISGNSVIVLTEGYAYAITGDRPDALSVRQVGTRQSCVSKRSITQMKDLVVYASPDGLVGIEGAQSNLLTENYYRRKEWQELVPSSMVGEVHDKRYIGFADGANIVFDFDEGLAALVETDLEAQGLYSDLETDSLFMIIGSNIVKWRGDPDNFLVMRWRTWEIPYKQPVSWSCCRVQAENYNLPVFIRFFAEEVLVHEQQITQLEAVRIPTLRDEKNWAFEVEAQTEIYEISVGTSMIEIAQGQEAGPAS